MTLARKRDARDRNGYLVPLFQNESPFKTLFDLYAIEPVGETNVSHEEENS